MPTKEEKRAKFVRLAEARTNKAIHAIRVIGNLSNRASYYYTADDVEQIFGALQKEIEACRERFVVVDEKEEGQTVFRLGRAEAQAVQAEAQEEGLEEAPAVQAEVQADRLAEGSAD